MDISKIQLNLESVAGGKEVLLLDIKEQYAYENNQLTNKLDGYKCKCVLPKNGYEQLVVKIDTNPHISPDLITSGEPIKVSFENFEGKIYRDYQKNTYALSCKAKSLVVLK